MQKTLLAYISIETIHSMTATHLVISLLGICVCIAAVSGWQRYLDHQLERARSAHEVRMSELETERLQIAERHFKEKR